MSHATNSDFGVVDSLWRYPVKSMLGEELASAQMKPEGMEGDRYFGLLDYAKGKLATAKNPRKWPTLFAFRAALQIPPGNLDREPVVQISLPDGQILSSEDRDCDQILSRLLQRDVKLVNWANFPNGQKGSTEAAKSTWSVQSEQYWPDIEGRDYQDMVTEFTLPAGTFFDCGPVHLLTTATLQRLGQLCPEGQLEVRRFRPNIVLSTGKNSSGFAEGEWIGKTLAIGEEVQLQINAPCGRCVMITLAQGGLPKDNNILRTVVQHNHGQVGVYAVVVRGGVIHRGDRVRFAGWE